MNKKAWCICISLLLLGALTACGHLHTWEKPTCTSAAFCPGCGESKGDPLGHSWENPTCTSAKICSTCGLTEGVPLSHQWVDASCETPKTCSACQATEGSALSHKWIDATCEQAKTCSVCAKSEGTPLGHNISKWKTKTKASCQASGIETGTCSECKETVERELAVLAHTPGKWEIRLKATATADGERVKKCTSCKQIIEQETYSLTAEEKIQLYKDSCKKYSYNDIARAPDKYKGNLAKFTGEVIQVQQTSLYGYIYYTLRVNVTKNGKYYSYYSDTVYVTYSADTNAPRILEDDIITMYGELDGEKTYTTVMGASVTIPKFNAEYIDIK